MFRSCRRTSVNKRTSPRALCIAAGIAIASPALAQDNPVILQWFENRWTNVEHKMPDFFLAGYGAVWLPPPSKASATGSAGYDVFDRFDLGRPGAETAFGTEDDFRAMVQEFHSASGLVYVDTILNHNSSRQTSVAFQNAGGWPGFWMAPSTPVTTKQPTSNWGDFHAGVAGGYLQSENPNGPLYDLLKGDLVALVDIAQESNNQFIRNPVLAGDPLNIPAGTVHNKPDPANARFYPDLGLTPFSFSNPGTSRNPGALNFSIHPFNTQTPLAGDAVSDNTTGYLMRWSQWLMDEHKVDGFRLDAIKHAPSWFFDKYFDSAVHKRRTTPAGTKVNPFTFGECVESPTFTFQNYIRKDAFADRDCLDLNGAGALRDILNAGGFGSWDNVLGAHLDNADNGFNDGSIGVLHAFSHDNGTTEGGGAQPPVPSKKQIGLVLHAYQLMRTGAGIVYHNARGIARPGGFWPDEGVPIAMGLDSANNALTDDVTELVRLHASYARGEFNVVNNTDPVNQSRADVLIFERRKNLGGGQYSGNVLVGVNDRYDSGTQTRNVLTSFPPGTRLREVTGNASDPVIDPTNAIPEVLIVDANKRVTIVVPNNRTGNTEHHKGYVIYGPAVPSGTLSVSPIASVIPADPSNAPGFLRRIADVPVVTADSFTIQLKTAKTDPLDPNWDDNAVFRINQGFKDFNGNGQVDIGEGGVVGGYEQFLTVKQPLFGSALSEGTYAQTINAADLPEGYNYVSVVAFRKRDANEDPLLTEFREVVYIDREGPAIALQPYDMPITSPAYEFRVDFLDRTAARIHMFWNLDPGVDPIPLCNATNQGTEVDRFEWRQTLVGLTHGFGSLTVVAFEDSGNASVSRTDDIFVDLCLADFNKDGGLSIDDFIAFQTAFALQLPEADIDGNGLFQIDDFITFQTFFALGC